MKWIFITGLILLAFGVFARWLLAQPGPKQLDIVSHFFPGDRNAKLVAAHQVYDMSQDLGLSIWAPKAQATAPLPVVIFFYGGSWQSGAKDEYGFVGRALASRGYITVLPDYRLYPAARFPDFLEDSAKAVAWAVDNIGDYGGDPQRIFLSGQSAGAYNAAMVALDRQWLGREGKSPELIKGVAALAGPYDFLPLRSDVTKQSFGHYHDPAMTQPVNFARPDAPVMWLAIGADDKEVGARNSQIMQQRILDAGGDAEYKEYPSMGHAQIVMALAKPFRFKAPVLDDMITFFERQA